MNARELISTAVMPLRTSDTGEEALQYMADFHLRHLPIINEQQVLGLLSEEDVYSNTAEEPIGSYALTVNHPAVQEDAHVFEVMTYLAEYHLTSVAVIDAEGAYIGLVTMEDVMQYYARSFAFREPGSIVVLRLQKRDYSLVELAHHVESEGAVILSSFVTEMPDSPQILVTLKINKSEIGPILSAFERHDFHIQAIHGPARFESDLKDRYDMFLHYLNM